MLKCYKWQFLGASQCVKIDFTWNLSGRNSWNFHIVYSQLGCPGLYSFTYFFQGSPLRWAAKADEIAMTTSMISTGSPMREHQPQNQPPAASIIENQQRSCSANHLDAIVDILGVPSELLTQRDFNKRLFLLKDKKGHPNGVLRRNLRTRHRY